MWTARSELNWLPICFFVWHLIKKKIPSFFKTEQNEGCDRSTKYRGMKDGRQALQTLIAPAIHGGDSTVDS